MTDGRPIIKGAPGLIWRRTKDGWEGLWRARADLIQRGYPLKNRRVWAGEYPSEREALAIADACQLLQDEMLVWGRGAVPQIQAFEGTLSSLVKCYQTDPDSRYHKKRYYVRVNHDTIYKRIVDGHGEEMLEDINARWLLAKHKLWSGDGAKVSMGHTFIGRLRDLITFGATILEDPECERLSGVLHKMRFPMGGARTERLTAEHAEAIRAKAHENGFHSIALAQALQFDLMLRQKDVIGEWVPLSEPGMSDTVRRQMKWLHGLRWSEIDENLVLRHTTSKKGKILEVDLKLAPMAMAEIQWHAEYIGQRPTTGPIVLAEATGCPWTAGEFRRKWRACATLAGVPKTVWSMDSRAGAISEATEAGAELEHVRHAATHSDISMTQRYSRGSQEKIAEVQKLRAAHRNKAKTSDGNG